MVETSPVKTEDGERAQLFRSLVDTHLAEAYALANAILRDRAAAEDAVQDGFVSAWERWESLRDHSKLDPWFKRIVINRCRNMLRERSRRQASDLTTERGPESPDVAGAALDRTQVEWALSRLKPDDRVVLALRYYRDLRIDDIAALLGIPSGTATSRLHRAHQRLRSVMQDEDRLEEAHR